MTSFVAVYNRIIKEKGIVETVVIPVRKPKMWGMDYEDNDCAIPVMCAPTGISNTMRCLDDSDERFSPKRMRARSSPGLFMSKAVDAEKHSTFDSDGPATIDDLIRHIAEKQNADGIYGSGNEIIRKTSAFIIGMILTKENWKPYRIQVVKASKALLNSRNDDLLKVIALCMAYEKVLINLSPDGLKNKLSKAEAAILEATMQDDLKPLSVHLGFNYKGIDNEEERNNLIKFILSMA